MLSMLVSFAYMTPNMLTVVQQSQGSVRWLLDSGAFTAFQLGKPIDIEGYIAFVKEHGHLFFQCIALDMIGNAADTLTNLQVMRDAGLNPMPVLTVDMHVDMLSTLVTPTCRAFCMAGGITEPIEHYGPRLSAARRRVGSDVWIHGLGFTRGTVVGGTQVTSVDSSSWTSGKRWGNLQWFDRVAGGIKHDRWSDLVKRPWREIPLGAQRAIIGMGLTREKLRHKSMTNGGPSTVGAQGVFAFAEYASWLGTLGKTFFFAVSNQHDAMCVLVGMAMATKTGILHTRWDSEWARCENGMHADIAGLARQAGLNAKNLWRMA